MKRRYKNISFEGLKEKPAARLGEAYRGFFLSSSFYGGGPPLRLSSDQAIEIICFAAFSSFVIFGIETVRMPFS